MFMKKRLLILAIGSMCLSFAGCSNSDNRSNGSKSSSVEADSKVVTDVDSSDHDVTTEENNLSNADMSKILLMGSLTTSLIMLSFFILLLRDPISALRATT